jgi:hypothetical protein
MPGLLPVDGEVASRLGLEAVGVERPEQPVEDLAGLGIHPGGDLQNRVEAGHPFLPLQQTDLGPMDA